LDRGRAVRGRLNWTPFVGPRVVEFKAVQLCRSGDSGGRKLSASTDSGDRERSSGGAWRRFFSALLRSRSNSPTTMAMRPSSKPVAGRSAGRYVDGQPKRVRSSPRSCLGGAAQYDRGPTSCAVWLWDARERVASAGRTMSAFASEVIPDRKRSYIPADIPGSRSWSAGSWKRAPARRSPSHPPE
jgi:hypothetical protein